MTEDERKLLGELADRIASTPAPTKDPDAEQFIRTHIGSRPDALYLMTQTVIIQNIALQQAQAQIQQLRRDPGGQSGQLGSGSFTGQGQGQGQAPPPPRQGYGPQYGQYAPPPPSYAAPTPAGPSPSTPLGGGGFLRGAAQTAAGVAAGALAFEGISSLFHHGMGGFGGGGMFGGGGIGGYAPPMDETIVNNYYDGGQQGGNNFDDQGGRNFGRDDYQATDEAAANAPDAGYDDSANQLDDNGAGFDDTGGGFDDGSGGGDNFA